nr:hypothetical protein [Mycobacterium uberis]
MVDLPPTVARLQISVSIMVKNRWLELSIGELISAIWCDVAVLVQQVLSWDADMVEPNAAVVDARQTKSTRSAMSRRATNRICRFEASSARVEVAQA